MPTALRVRRARRGYRAVRDRRVPQALTALRVLRVRQVQWVCKAIRDLRVPPAPTARLGRKVHRALRGHSDRSGLRDRRVLPGRSVRKDLRVIRVQLDCRDRQAHNRNMERLRSLRSAVGTI